jgi:hypothetical protein
MVALRHRRPDAFGSKSSDRATSASSDGGAGTTPTTSFAPAVRGRRWSPTVETLSRSPGPPRSLTVGAWLRLSLVAAGEDSHHRRCSRKVQQRCSSSMVRTTDIERAPRSDQAHRSPWLDMACRGSGVRVPSPPQEIAGQAVVLSPQQRTEQWPGRIWAPETPARSGSRSISEPERRHSGQLVHLRCRGDSIRLSCS